MIPLGILATTSGGAVPAYELISSTLISVNTATVTFDVTGLGSTYRHLQIRSTIRTNRNSSVYDNIRLQFNGDATNAYRAHRVFGNGSNVESADLGLSSSILFAYAPESTSQASVFAPAIVDVMDAFTSGRTKTIRSLSGQYFTNTGNFYMVAENSGLWTGTSAVTSITLLSGTGSSFVPGARFSLYGIKG